MLTYFPMLSPYSGLLHGVSTRHGGVSQGAFASLNLGWTVGDRREHVEANTRRLSQALGVQREHLTTTWQVHGKAIVRATAADRGTMIGKADGIITDVPNLPLIQRFADCTPILAYDPRRHVVGLAHAGWRGTVAGISGALIEAMTQAFTSDPRDMLAIIGPAIGPCCYEVGSDVVAQVRAVFPNGDELLVGPPGPTNGNRRVHLDLWAANRRQLLEAGVGQVVVSGVCTSCHRKTYYSHRADQGRTGRFATVAQLRP
jgi:YfiH family protein